MVPPCHLNLMGGWVMSVVLLVEEELASRILFHNWILHWAMVVGGSLDCSQKQRANGFPLVSAALELIVKSSCSVNLVFSIGTKGEDSKDHAMNDSRD